MRTLVNHKTIVTFIMIMMSICLISLISCQSKQEQKTEGVVVDKGVVHPEWSKNASIYEVNIRQYTPEGTFNAFAEHLPRLKDLGVDILWLMPMYPIGEVNRKGELGSYYSIKDYKDVNPEFGTMEDFKSLVNQAHNLGMYVILDWVPNHTAWDNPLIDEHPEWYSVDSLGNFVSPFDWTDVVQLNYENKELRDYMTGALKFWLIETNVDGFRCDVAGMVPLEYWNTVRQELEKVKPVFMLAEAEEPEHHQNTFDMSYAWEMHHIINDIAQGNKNANDLEQYFIKNKSQFPEEAYRMYFTSNHDENSWNGTEYERMGDAVKTFAALTFLVPGMPLIYSGQEASLDKRLRFFEKDTIPWDNLEMQDFYKKLTAFKKENPALWNGTFGGEFTRIPTNLDEDIFAFIREKDGKQVIAIFNLTGTPQEVSLTGNKYTGDYKELFTEKIKTIEENEVYNLEPWEYLIYH